ncbi:MAG: VWA domain-containing protein [Phycisphaerales bacterium]
MSLPTVHWGAPMWAHTLWAAGAVSLVLAWMWRRRAAEARRFAGPGVPRIAAWRRWTRSVLFVGAAACIAVALARPQTDPREREVTVRGRDVVFLIDVSRSMLAADLAPSRLERARLWVKDVAANLKGDRVGLVAFAGASVVACPLTLDYGFFTLALDELSPRSVPRGGSLIGDAIRKTLTQVFDPAARYRDIILITDGEDQESFPVEAADEAGKQGVRIIAIGVGSEAGATVPAEGGGATREGGAEVRSRLESGTLAKVAAATPGGVYFNVGTGTIDLERVYADLVAASEKAEIKGSAAVEYAERFPVLLALALACLFLEGFIRDRT